MSITFIEKKDIKDVCDAFKEYSICYETTIKEMGK